MSRCFGGDRDPDLGVQAAFGLTGLAAQAAGVFEHGERAVDLAALLTRPADVVERFSAHDRGCGTEPGIDPGRASRAEGDVLLVVTQPPVDFVPELPRPLGEAPENLGAVEFAAQLGKLLILWHAPLAGGDRPITVADVITRILSARAFARISARRCSGSTPSGDLT